MNDANVPTLYTWAGETKALEILLSRFYEKVGQDDMLAPLFAHMSPEHSRHVAHFIGEVFGGPPLYTEGDGGSHAGMIQHHIGRHLTEHQRRHWMNLLLDTADEVGLADDPEFRSSLVAYLEWGSRLAVLNSQTDDNPLPSQEPMPRWGWGETHGPYQPPQ